MLCVANALKIRLRVISADGDAKVRKAFLECATSEEAKSKIPIENDLLVFGPMVIKGVNDGEDGEKDNTDDSDK